MDKDTALPVLIWAGGRGLRMLGLTDGYVPKPLVPIAGVPLIEHLVASLAVRGSTQFFILGGFNAFMLEGWARRAQRRISAVVGPVELRVLDTGLDTGTGGRLLMASQQDVPFPAMVVYGDGLAPIDTHALRTQHAALRAAHPGVLVTLTAVRPPPRWGHMRFDGDLCIAFDEKTSAEGWVNGGYYVIEAEALGFIADAADSWELDQLPLLARSRRLGVFWHDGWWRCADTARDIDGLEANWRDGHPPWLPPEVARRLRPYVERR